MIFHVGAALRWVTHLGKLCHSALEPFPYFLTSLLHYFRASRLRNLSFFLSLAPSERETARSHGSRATICIPFTRAFRIVSPQCKCGPVTRPVAPTLPISCPASAFSPGVTPISDRWQYIV